MFGADINWSFCNSFQACFSDKGVFLGLDYLGSNPQIVVGKPMTCDIKEIEPTYHLVLEGEKNGNRTQASSTGR